MPKRGKRSSPADAVDEQLARYRAMRDFAMTAEPRGSGGKKSEGLPFVIQKHAATRLHYDFRLGWRGVLKSWAVAKGPSYNPADKRLAVEVEDHPIEYGGFEGTIPKGQYGGGTVMVWDQGTWEPVIDADEGLRKGHLKFVLHGKKLKGHWALIRMHPREHDTKPNWLLIKEHDEFERGAKDAAITEEAPESAVTGRNLEEIGEEEDHVWNSDRPVKKIETSADKSRANRSRLKVKTHANGEAPERGSVLQESPRETMPKFIAPELAVPVTEPPEGDDWLHELKLDGYRMQMHVEESKAGRKVRLYTRKGLDWTQRMPGVAEAGEGLPVHSAILDGEVVVLNEQGVSSFADLQAAFEEGAKHPLTYFAFDLLHLDGHNLRGLPLERRKAILEGIFQELGENEILRYSSHLRARGGEMFRQACGMGAEGIVSKQASSRYESTRSRSWLKSKCALQQELVVGGYTPMSTGEEGIGSLLLGYYEGGKLKYAGRSGTGFTQKQRRMLEERLERLRATKTAFDAPPREAKKDAIWVKPELVVEVRFATWTAGNRVRQAAFLGIREDKKAGEVVREKAVSTARATNQESGNAGSASRKRGRAKSAAGRAGTSHAEPAGGESTMDSQGEKRERPDERGAEVAGVRLSNPDKVLDEESRLTKRQLAEYYAAVAENMLPHIANRPLSIVRCPNGTTKPCFFQKHVGMGVPHGVESVAVPSKKGGAVEDYLTVATSEGLVGLAQLGVLEVHPWGSTNDSLEKPDRIIIDLDPDADLPWKRVVESAVEVRELLRQLGLKTFVKSTGGKGIHVVAPIEPRLEWPVVKDFTHNFVLMMERANPSLYLTKMSKAARKGRIFLDYLRNERGATAVAAWSPRARAGARVAVPLTWSELEKSTESPRLAVSNFGEWKGRLKRDPWNEMGAVKQELTDQAVGAISEMLSQKSA